MTVTNASKEEEKEQFYYILQSILEKCLERDVNMLMGDFNSKIEKDNIGYTEVMGSHGLGDMNKNG